VPCSVDQAQLPHLSIAAEIAEGTPGEDDRVMTG
jgi:hypothetical protein